jgi:hypothetical protein
LHGQLIIRHCPAELTEASRQNRLAFSHEETWLELKKRVDEAAAVAILMEVARSFISGPSITDRTNYNNGTDWIVAHTDQLDEFERLTITGSCAPPAAAPTTTAPPALINRLQGVHPLDLQGNPARKSTVPLARGLHAKRFRADQTRDRIKRPPEPPVVASSRECRLGLRMF